MIEIPLQRGGNDQQERIHERRAGHDKVTAIPGYLKSICDPDIVKYLWSDKVNVD